MASIAQGAFASFPAAAGLDLSTEIIVCTPYSDIAEYQGTRAALEAEGVIPAGLQWPEGFNERHWQDGRFNFWVRRQRPEGAKGPRKQFLEVDWWMLRCAPLQTENIVERNLNRKRKELEDYAYRNSPKGQAELDQRWSRYWEAQRDEKFQAFKALIPGMIRPRRGRRPKTLAQS